MCKGQNSFNFYRFCNNISIVEKYLYQIYTKNIIKIPKVIQHGSLFGMTVTYDKKRYSATRDTAKECE